MRIYDSQTLAAIEAGQVKLRLLLWVGARNRQTGALEFAGFWNGDQTEEITVAGEARVYNAGVALDDQAQIVAEQGNDVQFHRLSLSPLAEPVRQAVLGYELSLAPLELHRAVYDIATDRITGAPHRLIRGWVDAADWTDGAEGQPSTLDLSIASASRSGTRFAESVKSDADQRAAHPDDGFHRWASVSNNEVLQI